MDAIELLSKYKKRVEPKLQEYFSRKIKQAGDLDPIAKRTVRIIKEFTMASGKRIRPALVYYGYMASGGRDSDEIVEASMAIELIHSFLLIHDDIIDRDEKRHGIPTVHETYGKWGRRLSLDRDVSHFGNSMAMIAGDMTFAMANEIIFTSKFQPETILKALNKLQEIVYLTIPGEMLDVVMELKGSATESEILRMFEGKTSRYTFEGPLHLGGIFGGCDETLLENFSRYSLPLGKAFQVRDDILGLFGDEKKLGKPVGSDVIEGKQTILYVKAMEKANDRDRTVLEKYLRKKDLTKKELEEFKVVIKNTGSLDYCQRLAERFADEALEAIRDIEFKNSESEIFLNGLARYIIQRNV